MTVIASQIIDDSFLYSIACSSFKNKANLRDLIAATGLVILLKSYSNRRFVWPWNLDDLETIGHLFHTTSWFVHHLQSILWILVLIEVNQVYVMDKSLQCSIRVKIGNFLSRVMTLKNNTAHLLCYIKLSASFYSHQWIQTGVTFWKCPIWVKIDDFFVPCDLEIWRMTLKKQWGTFPKEHQALCFISSS